MSDSPTVIRVRERLRARLAARGAIIPNPIDAEDAARLMVDFADPGYTRTDTYDERQPDHD